jgi:hypothetical protein
LDEKKKASAETLYWKVAELSTPVAGTRAVRIARDDPVGVVGVPERS